VEAFHLAAGYGHVLVQAAFRLVPAREPVFAAVSPGNARSFRVFIAAGFRTIGSEVLIVRRRS
jgi:L-amino acid N-acyltransferase YncA